MIVRLFRVITMVNVLTELPLSHATVQAHLQARGVKGGSENACTSRAKIMGHALRETGSSRYSCICPATFTGRCSSAFFVVNIIERCYYI